VAGVDEDELQLGHGLLLRQKDLPDLGSVDGAERTDGELGIILELKLALFGAVADDVEYLGLLEADEMLEVLLGADLAFDRDLGLVGVLSGAMRTLREL
jgi:hypothetical protein